MQIIPPKASQESTTILQLKVYSVYVVQNSWKPTFAEVSYKFGFVRLSICLQSIISFFLSFFHDVRDHKVKKVTDPGF